MILTKALCSPTGNIPRWTATRPRANALAPQIISLQFRVEITKRIVATITPTSAALDPLLTTASDSRMTQERAAARRDRFEPLAFTSLQLPKETTQMRRPLWTEGT